MMWRHLTGLTALLALLAACSTNDSAQTTPVNLEGTAWRLVELQSSDDTIGIVRPDDPAKYELHLNGDGRAALRLDCNRAAGAWTSSATGPAQGNLSFQPLLMTRAMCPPGSLDTRIARELDYVRTYIVEGDTLHLIMMADGGSQLWARLNGPD